MSARTVRVLQFLGTMDYGGVESWLMEVLRHIDRAKFQIDFCFTRPEPGAFAPEIEALGSRMVPCRLEKSNLLHFTRGFRSLLREGRYDIVHSHVHHFSGFILRLAQRMGVPGRVAHCHSTSDGNPPSVPRLLYWALMKRWVRKHATLGLATSQAAAAALFGRDWQHDPRFRVLYCGIDLVPFRQKVSREEVRRELGIPFDAPVVGHVGHFVRVKNHAFLLRVAGEVAKVRSEVRFLLVGDGPLRAQMEKLAQQLGIRRNLVFAGARSDVPRLMLGAMDLLVMPSLWEGLGLVVVEAQAAGLRCVTSTAVPPDAVVVEGAVDSLSLSVDASGWAQHLLRALEGGPIDKLQAVRLVEQSPFNVQTSVSRLAALYEEAVRP